MTTKTLTGTYASGYTLAANYSGLDIGPTAFVGGTGVYSNHVAAVVNLGTIDGSEKDDAYGVVLRAGGNVTNGSATDTGALIYGPEIGLLAGGSATVINFGTIASRPTQAVRFQTSDSRLIVEKSAVFIGGIYGDGGTLELAGGNDTITGLAGGSGGMTGSTAASIYDFNSFVVDAGASLTLKGASTLTTGQSLAGGGSFVNTGTLSSDAGGVFDVNGGRLVNGATNLATALIEGYNGVTLYGGSVATNFGTIQGAGSGSNGIGVYVSGSGVRLTNGAAGHAGAVIEAYYMGVKAAYGANLVVTNFGTIEATGAGVDSSAMAVDFGASSDTLVVEAGSSFIGAVNGGGGTLELASGKGAINNAFAGGAVTVSGLLAATTTFAGFGELFIAAPATITLSGASGSLATGQSLVDQGTLTVAGALAGAGRLALEAGTTTFAAGASLTLAKVSVTGAKTVIDVAASLSYAGTWIQTGGILSVAAGDQATFRGKSNTFTGTLAGAGSVEVFGGSDLFSNLTLSAKSQTVKVATITLSGVIDLTTSLAVTTPSITVAAAGASLTGGGRLELSNTDTNAIIGASATARLTNVSDTILGAGLLGNGEMVLVNEAGGVIDADDSDGLSIATGANTISNAGLIESTGSGGLTIYSAVKNSGTLEAAGGPLVVTGAVFGSGVVTVDGGLAALDSSFSENVSFTAAGGTLLLAQSQSYKGTITGFATTPITTLELNDIAFGAATKATYSGTTTSGTLTVTDGTHTARIKLAGNYTTSTFTVKSDGDGGTTVFDPIATAGHTHAFIAAIAGLGAPGGTASAAAEPWRAPVASLAPPNAV